MTVKEMNFSSIGITGYHKCMDKVIFKGELINFSQEEIDQRADLLNEAIDKDINFFDVSSKNELRLLALVWEKLKNKDDIFISLTTPSSFDISFDDWLDECLRIFPYKRFDAIVVKNITKVLKGTDMEELLRVLNKRREMGDFNYIGFRSKKTMEARVLLENYPDFDLCFLIYNYYCRDIERSFAGYDGRAKIIAINPLNWWDVEIPFNVLNNYSDFKALFGFEKSKSIVRTAYKYVMQNPVVYSTMVTVKDEKDLEAAIKARKQKKPADVELLKKYAEAAAADKYIALLAAALRSNEPRMMLEATKQLFEILGEEAPVKEYISLGSENLYNIIMDTLFDKYVNLGYEKYFML